jgi:aryl-alcohol dehydrogenase-like predicted oxidoreductase
MVDRTLGDSGIAITPFMLGGNVFGWTIDEPTSFAVLDTFVDGGGNAIDTADVYSTWVPGNRGGESETIIGRWLASRGGRDKVVIATKVGKLAVAGEPGLSRKQIEAAAEASLQRLQTDYIDLYQAHADDPAVPLDETLEAFDRLVRAGKVRAIGASNYTAPRLAEALDTSGRLGIAGFQTMQPEFNLMQHDSFEGALQDLCVERGIAVIPYYGLASGFLTGKYRSEADLAGRERGRGVSQYLNPRGMAVLDALDTVAQRRAATPAQVSLSWMLAQPAIAAPIASATSSDQLNELLGAVSLRLAQEDLALLDDASRS